MHSPTDRKNELRCVYVAEFSDGYAYVGTASDYKKRIGDHLFGGDKSQVFQHKRHTGLVPSFSMISDYVNAQEADRIEYEQTIHLASLGKKMLNVQRPGGYIGHRKVSVKRKDQENGYVPVSFLSSCFDYSMNGLNIILSVFNTIHEEESQEVRIYLCDLARHACDYADIEQCAMLLSGNNGCGFIDSCNAGTDSGKYLQFHINRADPVFERKRYVPYKKLVISESSSKYTSRMYIILSILAATGKRSEYSLSLNELKKMLGVESRYKKEKDFRLRVIERFTQDMKDLYDRNISDFYITFQTNRRKGNTEYSFTLHHD